MKRAKLTCHFTLIEYMPEDPSYRRKSLVGPLEWDGVKATKRGRMEAMGIWKACNEEFMKAGEAAAVAEEAGKVKPDSTEFVKRGNLLAHFELIEYHKDDASYRRSVFDAPCSWDGVVVTPEGRNNVMEILQACVGRFVAAGAARVEVGELTPPSPGKKIERQ